MLQPGWSETKSGTCDQVRVPDGNIAIHCTDGKAASHSYFTLRLLGYPRVRVYDRSWSEWGMADELPKTIPSKG